MLDYSKAMIYKLVCNNTGLLYVGSTCQPLHKRLAGHKKDFKLNYRITSTQIIANGNYSIILIEEYPCQNKQQLLRKEREHIDALECVNKLRPGRTEEEKAVYYQDYRNNNKALIACKNKTYRDKNKDTINEKGKVKITCSICKTQVRKHGIKRHCRSMHKPDYINMDLITDTNIGVL